MTRQLDIILEAKQHALKALKHAIAANPKHPITQCLESPPVSCPQRLFKAALNQPGLSVVAEIKRRSPSAGVLSAIEQPVDLAKRYERAGACAISVLTESEFFHGSLEDLSQVSQAVSIPTLRKDFVLDVVHIAEAALQGAKAVLLIVSVVKDKLSDLLEWAHRLGIEALVEVYSYDELQYAIESGADIIGVNNRDLNTFNVDYRHCLELIDAFPKGIIRLAASGIHTKAQAQTIYEAGYDAILVGEALVRREQPEHLLSELREVA